MCGLDQISARPHRHGRPQADRDLVGLDGSRGSDQANSERIRGRQKFGIVQDESAVDMCDDVGKHRHGSAIAGDDSVEWYIMTAETNPSLDALDVDSWIVDGNEKQRCQKPELTSLNQNIELAGVREDGLEGKAAPRQKSFRAPVIGKGLSASNAIIVRPLQLGGYLIRVNVETEIVALAPQVIRESGFPRSIRPSDDQKEWSLTGWQ